MIQETESFLQVRRNLQHWISEAIDLNAIASSLAANLTSDHQAKGSNWHECLMGDHMSCKAEVERWMQDVAKIAAPVMWTQVDLLRKNVEQAAAQDAEKAQKDECSKFTAEAKFGTIDNFYCGLDQIGLPQPSVFEQMRKEHLSIATFKVTNYGGETCPLDEWNLVVNVIDHPPKWAQDLQQKVCKTYSVWRELRGLEHYMHKDIVKRANLTPEELMACAYTPVPCLFATTH